MAPLGRSRLRACAILLGIAVAGTPLAGQSIRLAVPFNQLEARALQDSADARVLYDYAVGLMSRERYAAADSVLRRAVSLNPQLADGWFALGLVRGRDRRFWNDLRRTGDAAVTAERVRRAGMTRKAFLVDPFVDVRLLATVVQRPPFYPDVFVLSLSAFLEGDYGVAFYYSDMAFRHFVQRTTSYDSLPPLLLWVHGLAAARSARYREALIDIQALLNLSQARERNDSTFAVPLNTNEYRYMLAAVHQKLQENTLAIRMYEGVLANDVGNYMVHVQLARIHEAERGWMDAIRHRRLAVEVNPEDHSLRYDLGLTLSRAERWAEAEEPLEEAVRMQPAYPSTHWALGVVKLKLGKTGEARASLNRFIELAPSRDPQLIEDARRRLAELGSP